MKFLPTLVDGMATQPNLRQRGFTLIELLVAIAFLALIAVLSWRGLDQIARGRQIITTAMEDERFAAQLFEQVRIDAIKAASDDESGGAAISLVGGTLQIVRALDIPGGASRLQVVRYRVADGRVVRYASPPFANQHELQRAENSSEGKDWREVPLMAGVGSFSVRLFVPKVGWTIQMEDVEAIINENNALLKLPQPTYAPSRRSVNGVEVSISSPTLQRPLTRVVLVGE